MPSIDESIDRVEKLYRAVTGEDVVPTDAVYAPIPAEVDPAEHVEQQLDRLLERLGALGQTRGTPSKSIPWSPPVTVWEAESEIVLWFDLPGVTREQVELTVQGNALSVSGGRAAAAPELKEVRLRASERPLGSFRRTVLLPLGTRTEPTAHLRDGVLEVRIPKESREATLPKAVRIQ